MIQDSLRGAQALKGAILALALLLAGCAGPGGPSATATAPTAAVSAPTTTSATAVSAPTPAPTTTGATAVPAPTPAPTVASATPVPAPAPTAASATAVPPAPAGDADAAVQTVIDYYQAINQQQYDAAYTLWANKGAASGQTLDQFKQGFAQTVAANVRLGAPQPTSNAIAVPIELIAISNDPDPQKPQIVQQFRGMYTAAATADGWRLTNAVIAEANDAALPPAEVTDPAQTLQNYYAAINSRMFAHAYTFWSNNGKNSNQRYTDFARGFAATAQVIVTLGKAEVGAAAGSAYTDIPTLVVAKQNDGSQQTFCGTYTLRRLNVPPFDQLGWHIEKAEIAPHAAVPPNSAAQILANGCK